MTFNADGSFIYTPGLHFNGAVISNNIPLNLVSQVRAWGRAGNDRIEVLDLAIISMLHGGSGNDELTGGAGNDLIFGGSGDDKLTGAAGNDFLIGGLGADRIVGSAGHDILVAGCVGCASTEQDLRAISAAWAASKSLDAELVDAVLDETGLVAGFDQLTGSAGADWFIISGDDKVTDWNAKNNKDGDVLTIV